MKMLMFVYVLEGFEKSVRSRGGQIMHHSMLPLIISFTRSWNFAWHLWRSKTESKNIVKLLAIIQIIHTVRYEDDYFPKGKFTLFNSLFHLVYLLPICLPCVICGSYVTKINAEMWHSALHSRRLACIRSHVLRAYCNFESKQANSITLFG